MDFGFQILCNRSTDEFDQQLIVCRLLNLFELFRFWNLLRPSGFGIFQDDRVTLSRPEIHHICFHALNYATTGREGGENDVGRCWNSKIADWYPHQSTSSKLVVWDSNRSALK